MFLFPIVYISAFVIAMVLIWKKQIKGLLIFIIFGLPIYINALSVTFMYGFTKAIPIMQGFKEISLFAGFILVILMLKKKPRFHLVDKLILAFFIITLIYLVLPIGPYDFYNRLIGFKSLSVFPVIYFTGRFCDVKSINTKHIFSYICVVSLIAAVVLLFEVIPYQHLHTKTGFLDFLVRYFGGSESGNYGLIWTFETETGFKRFGSIFSSPLELSSASILTLSLVLALITNNRNRLNYTGFYVITLAATLFCVIFAVSRASFVNYFITIYFFALLTKNKKLIKYFHVGLLIGLVCALFFLSGNLLDFIIVTLNFESSSSIGHVLAWLEGINAMIAHPFGLGIGTSGTVSMADNDTIGGENQLIIIGVQVGILMDIIYIWIYALLIKTGIQALSTATGKKKRLILGTVLLKIGIIIPLFTSYIDTFIYITYTAYFLSGLMMNMITNDLSFIKKEANNPRGSTEWIPAE